MENRFAVTQIPGMDTGEIPPSPVDRDEKTAFIYGLVDPIWDIDTLPLTYANSRWSAFFYRADEKDLRRVLPECLELEDDIVEFWYVDHNHTGLGPYNEMGVTIAASFRASDGKVTYGGYYPYMYLTQDAAIDAGRTQGFPKKQAFIRILEHGGHPDDGRRLDAVRHQFDFFSFLMIRNGYVIHSATGRYDDAEPADLPVFYKKPEEYGRFNIRVVTSPDVMQSEWELIYEEELLDPMLAGFLGRPEMTGKSRFMKKPETMRTASPAAINWFMQATPFDNVGRELPPKEMLGLMSFNFDLLIPAGQVLWSETYTRDETWLGAATPSRYGLRQRFPKMLGLGA
jgi:hypothetical protein